MSIRVALEGRRKLARHASVWQRGRVEFVLEGIRKRGKKPKCSLSGFYFGQKQATTGVVPKLSAKT
jgi:hypothetical protein